MSDHDNDIDNLRVGEVLDYLAARYEEDKFLNSFANARRSEIIQACDLYLSDNPKARHEATEPLAWLADRKGCYISGWGNTGTKWCIGLVHGDTQTFKESNGDTYAAAEAAARKFLEGLTDKGGTI